MVPDNATNIKLILAYDGTRYRGWQKLGDSEKTLQGRLEGVLSRICGESIEVIGSGRTDAGVHALGQCANFRTASDIPPSEVMNLANRYLPEDMVILSAEATDERFHARYNAMSKTYLYKLLTGPLPDPFLRHYAWHTGESLQVPVLQEAAGTLIGHHDFQSFTALKPGKKSTERHLTDIDITPIPRTGGGYLLEIRLTADGFLYNMVRLIIGTLVRAGKGELEPADIRGILTARKRSLAGPLAPPQGLYLEKVIYR